ncbi:hypothetical protein [Sorangium sp. So ce385]|uniref:hypothetical protein n=1 Tax=Sorangium sp. So ce385 TaxID=3133308 RepID=UPI003F5AFA74
MKSGYEFQSEFARRYVTKGVEKGRGPSPHGEVRSLGLPIGTAFSRLRRGRKRLERWRRLR